MKGKGHDYSNALIWAALLVTVTRYAGAFIASDVTKIPEWLSITLSAFMGVSGLGMGVLDVLGLSYVFDGWRKVMPRVGQTWPFRFWVLTGFVIALFITGVGILVPFTVSRVAGSTMSATLGAGGIWFWSIGVNLAPYLLIGGIVTGQSGFVAIKEEPTASATNAPHDARIPAHTCKQCGASFDSSPKLAAHMRWQHDKNARPAEVGATVTEHSNGKSQ